MTKSEGHAIIYSKFSIKDVCKQIFKKNNFCCKLYSFLSVHLERFVSSRPEFSRVFGEYLCNLCCQLPRILNVEIRMHTQMKTESFVCKRESILYLNEPILLFLLGTKNFRNEPFMHCYMHNISINSSIKFFRRSLK